MDEEFKSYLGGLLTKLGLAELMGTWEEQWLEGPGGRLYGTVFEAGTGKPTVVFIPGTAVYALCYVELMAGLRAEGVNVVGFDPRGQGQSSGHRGDYTIMEHVADARAAIAYARKRFGGPVFAMGSSQGGIEAFYLAATDEPLAGCVCHNIADLPDPESPRLTRFGPQGPVSPALAAGFKVGIGLLKIIAAIFPLMPVPISVYLDLRAEPMRAFGNAWNFFVQDPSALKAITIRAAASIASTPLPRPIGEIKTPILVLHASGDNIFPADYVTRLFNQLTCDKQLQVYPGLPHLITIEHVKEILPDVVAWIKRK